MYVKKMSKLIFVEELPKVLDKNYIYIITSGPITKKYSSSKFIYHYTEFNKGFKNPNYFNKNLFFLQEFVDQKFDGKSIKELLIYKNFSLWYFFEYFMFYETLETKSMDSLGRVMYDIDCYENCVVKLKPKNIFISENNSKFKIIKDISKKFEIELKVSKKFNFNFKIKKEFFFIPFLSIKFFIKVFIGFILNISKKKQNLNCDILNLSSDRFFSKGNISLYPNLEKEFNTVNIIYERVWMLSFNQIKNLLSIRKYNGFLYIGQFNSFKDILKIFKLHFFIKKLYRKKLKVIFKKNLTYNNYNLYDYSSEKVNFSFDNFSFFVSDILISLDNVYSKISTKSIFIEQEENYYGKASLILNKDNNIKFFSPQTELIYRDGCLHRHYNNISLRDKKNILWRPLPDIKFVSGEYTKNILLNYGNYNSDNVKVVGIPKFENLSITNFNKESILKKYSINDNYEKIIVFAGGGVEADCEKIFSLMDSINNLDSNYLLIIKAHPSSNKVLLNKIVKSRDYSFVKVILEGNIDEVIAISDLFVSVHSTAIMDAFILEKPVLLINEFEEFMPYSELTKVLVVRDLDKLEFSLSKSLKKEYSNEVVPSYESFINQYLSGNKSVSENIFKLIKKELNN